MTILEPGHRYALNGFEDKTNTHELQFIHKNEDGVVCDGTTTEEVLAALIDRTATLNAKFPCKENAVAITHMETALLWLNKRTADRIARGVEGQHKA